MIVCPPTHKGYEPSVASAKEAAGRKDRSAAPRQPQGPALGRLGKYASMRDPSGTPEPMPSAHYAGGGSGSSFVIQEHHARALHWDFRLEREGVLVSWAIPKGLPQDPGVNRLAVQTEDHPIEYVSFEGEIPAGHYGAGTVEIWDRGSYECEKWTDKEVKITLAGTRARGRYVLFRTGDKNWMVHRMEQPPEGFEPLPELVAPMLATPGTIPENEEGWAYEYKWDGARAMVYVEGGRVRILSRNGRDVTVAYPELKGLGEALGARPAILDGEIVALGKDGIPSFSALGARMGVVDAAKARRLAVLTPVSFVAFDVVHLDGQPTTGLPYDQRRSLLEGLGLSGESWTLSQRIDPPGEDVLAVATKMGLEGVVAKRTDSTYHPGRRDPSWIKVKAFKTQEVVIGGWTQGSGRREGQIGALLVGIPQGGALAYGGKVGTGFSEAVLADLRRALDDLETVRSPFAEPLPKAEKQGAHWVHPQLVGEVRFSEWTSDGRMRHPSWRGLRMDKEPDEVVRES